MSDIVREVEKNLKKRNQIFFSWESECLAGLLELMSRVSRKTLVLWAFECSEFTLAELEKRAPSEMRPRFALEKSREWAAGRIKMPEAKSCILAAHAAAKETNDRIAASLCHAAGQAASAVHTEAHAAGLAFYELTAIVLMNEDYEAAVSEKIDFYCRTLKRIAESGEEKSRTWAKFLADDKKPNRIGERIKIK